MNMKSPMLKHPFYINPVIIGCFQVLIYWFVQVIHIFSGLNKNIASEAGKLNKFSNFIFCGGNFLSF